MRIAMLSKAVVVAAYQRKLEELARLPGVELVVLAPPAWRDSRGETRLERTYTAGASGFVTKPASFRGLREAIAKIGAYWLGTVDLPEE